MVGVAQLVERRIVVPKVAGSNPVTHPTQSRVAVRPEADLRTAPPIHHGYAHKTLTRLNICVSTNWAE